MASSAIWREKKHARVSFSKTIKEVFEKLASVCFFKLHEKPYYYLGQKKICGFPVSSYKNVGRVGRF